MCFHKIFTTKTKLLPVVLQTITVHYVYWLAYRIVYYSCIQQYSYYKYSPKISCFKPRVEEFFRFLHHQRLWRFELGTEHSRCEAKHYQSITSRTSPTPSKHTSFSCKPHHIIVLTSFPFRIKVIIIQINVVQHSAVQIPFHFIFLKTLEVTFSFFVFFSVSPKPRWQQKAINQRTNGP